jgi:pimeloyl-ACP methyl ester carboxylesterase
MDTFIPGKIGQLAVRVKKNASASAPAVVLVQGSNLTGQTIFDFHVSGLENYSLMDALVSRGFTAITFSIRGYGKSDPPADPFSVTTDAGMEDLNSVIDWVIQQGYEHPHVLGYSWGGRVVGRYAEMNSSKIRRLVLLDPARGGGNVVLPAPVAGEEWFTNSNQRYHERLEPEFTDPILRQAISDYVVTHEPRSPNGIRLENASLTIAVDPKKITSPTLLIYGVHAAKALYMQGGMDRATFFENLATDDKSFVILPGGGDYLHLQAGRHRLHDTIAQYLSNSAKA